MTVMNAISSISASAAPVADPIAELLAAADSWERRRSAKLPRSVTTEAEARLAAAVQAMRGRPGTREIVTCARCGEAVDLDTTGPCRGVKKAGT